MAAVSKLSSTHALFGAAVFWALVAAASAAENEHWHRVKGKAIESLFADKEFADGVHFAYQFNANGTFTGTEMTKAVSGAWRVDRNEFCWKWLRPAPPGAEECYQVQRDGAHVRLIVNRSEAWYGTLEPLR